MAAQAELRDKVAHLVQQHAGELDAKDRFCDEVLLALSDPLEAGSGDSGNDDDIFTLLLNPLLARLQSSNPFHSFRANKLLLEFLSSFNVVDDRLQTFFALLLQNLDPLNMCRCHSMRSHETTHALTFTLDLLQRLLKRFRRRMKQSEMDDLDPCVPILLHVLAQKSDGRVAWIEGLVYHWQHLPPKVLPYFTILIHSLLKTYRLCDGDMVAAPFRRDLLVVAQYISSYLPVLGIVLDQCPHAVARRKTLEIFHYFVGERSIEAITLPLASLQPYISRLPPVHIPNTTVDPTTESTEFILTNRDEIDKESVKIIVSIGIESIAFGWIAVKTGQASGTAMKRWAGCLGRCLTGLDDLLADPNLPSHILTLFIDNDAQLFRALTALKDLWLADQDGILAKTFPSLAPALRNVSPHRMFILLVKECAFDVQVYLDWMISGESGFLEYFMGWLRIWEPVVFVKECGDLELPQESTGEGGVAILHAFFFDFLERLEGLTELFPYNVEPLLKRIRSVVEDLTNVLPMPSISSEETST